MDLSKVEQNEEKRQNLIKLQEGDGSYNPITGTYKWGSNVYDLTKTNGEPGLGWLPIRNKPLEYKTIHQNKSELEQFYSKENLVEKMKVPTLINNLTIAVMQLDRYDASYNDNIDLCKDGEYIKIEDVLKLFSAEKT